LTEAHEAPYTDGMEVHLPDSQEAQLNDLAAKTGRGTDELVQEAVARLLSHNEWFKQQVQIGIDQIERGEFIEEAEMDARVERLLQS
jgi:predicted transcriptional regulator